MSLFWFVVVVVVVFVVVVVVIDVVFVVAVVLNVDVFKDITQLGGREVDPISKNETICDKSWRGRESKIYCQK